MRTGKTHLVFNNQRFRSKQEFDFEKNLVNLEETYQETYRSTVFMDEHYFYKLLKPRHLIRSTLRLLMGKSKAGQEVFGNQLLRQFDLQVPELKFHGVNVLSKQHNEILVFEKLKNFITVKQAILDSGDPHYIRGLLANVAEQLNTLIRNNVFFHDFHFCNVMVNPEGTLYWVDTSATIIENPEEMAQRVNHKFHSFRFQQEWLGESHWEYFKRHVDADVMAADAALCPCE